MKRTRVGWTGNGERAALAQEWLLGNQFGARNG
jgi:hypothetical protein